MSPKPERGRSEDPTVESLIHSGETVRDRDGNDVMVEVRGWHLKKKDWGGSEPPLLMRRKMDFGYRAISEIDWVDCQ